jgi:outer membrane protein, heavy metal efflux system
MTALQKQHRPMRSWFLLLLGGFLAAGNAAADPLACPAGALTLTVARDQAAHSNPDVLAAQGQLDAANAGVTLAGERPNPTLNLLANQYDPRRSANVGGASHTPVFASAQITQTFERGGKRRLRLDAAQASASAATADLADTLRRSDAAVRAAYYDLKFALAKREALADVDALQQQTLEAADRRLKAGDISAADRARIALEAIKAQNERLSAEAAQARIVLASLMGCAGGAALEPLDSWPGDTAVTKDAAPAVSSGQRADELAAAARAAAAEASLALARSQLHRDVTLGVEYDHDPRVAPHMAGISISVPLFLAHHYEGEIAQAVAQRDSARQAAVSTELLASADRDSAIRALAAAAERRQRSVNEVLPQAERAAGSVEYAYAHGAATLLDLLDARRTLRAARLDALAAENDYAHALVAHDAALAVGVQVAGRPAATPAP